MTTTGAPYEASYGAARDARRQEQLDRIDAMRERNVLPAEQLDSARAVVLLGSDSTLGELLTAQLLERLVDAFEQQAGYIRHLRGTALLRVWSRTPSLAVRTGYLLRLLTSSDAGSGERCATRRRERSARTPCRRRVLATPAPSNAPPTGRAMPALSTHAPP